MAKLIVTLNLPIQDRRYESDPGSELTELISLIGGKAMNLAKLKQAGFSVPNAFVVTTAVNKITEKLKLEINNHLQDLKTKTSAVRSSATVEDTKSASFAGQFESYLGVTPEKVIEAIEKCWASAKSERVLIYCQHQKINPEKIKMAVIVQEMIFAEKGGVIFTENVFQNKKNELIIEAAKGLGEKVVSGLVNPERIIINKRNRSVPSGVSSHPGGARFGHPRGVTPRPSEPVLTDKEITQLVEIALKIEALYGCAQDIEWAIMNNQIYILQSRPITK